LAAEAALGIGEVERGITFMETRLIHDLAPVLARLEPEAHVALDHPRLAPRRSEMALVWPLEAPMIDAARHALFREVRIESGIPVGSEMVSGR
jgi:hypothetical protein